MEENKKIMEEQNDVTSDDTEQKDNNKKNIIISLILISILVIGLISWFIVSTRDKGETIVCNESDTVKNVAENITSSELESTKENKITEEQMTEKESTLDNTTTEEQTTEEESILEETTIEQTTDKDETTGNTTIVAEKENSSDEATFEYESGFIIGAITQSSTTAPKVPTEEEILAESLEIDKGSYKYGYYEKEDKTIYNIRSKDDIVMKEKNKWIKKNYGTCFTHNGIEFYWDESNQAYYWIYNYGRIHYMTSTTTSTIGQYYKNFYSFRIADYLGFYGTDYDLYHSEEALYDGIDELNIEYGSNETDEMTVDNPYKNNFAYLKQLGWTEVDESDGVSRHWSFESPEGIPASFSCTQNEDYFISIYIKYPQNVEEKMYNFTIEEYNDLVRNSNWKICTKSGKMGWQFEDPEEWKPYIRKYLLISE